MTVRAVLHLLINDLCARHPDSEHELIIVPDVGVAIRQLQSEGHCPTGCYILTHDLSGEDAESIRRYLWQVSDWLAMRQPKVSVPLEAGARYRFCLILWAAPGESGPMAA